jgi:hypothetical protein
MPIDYESIVNLLRLLPEPAVAEVADFAGYLVRKHGRLAVDEQTARRRANGWLVTWVGNMVMADQARMTYVDERPVWRFGAFLTSLSYPPRGPIGTVDVDANTGDILNTEDDVEAMQRAGEALGRSPSSTTQIAELKRSILNLRLDLKAYEEKYQLTTEAFYQQFTEGNTDDREAYIIWAGVYEMLRENEARLQDVQ